MNKFSIIAVVLALLLQSHALRPSRINARRGFPVDVRAENEADPIANDGDQEEDRDEGRSIRLMDEANECDACATDANCDGADGEVCKDGCCAAHYSPPDEKPRESNSDAGGLSNPACGTCTEAQLIPGCSVQAIQDYVCDIDSYCCDFEWDPVCVDYVLYYDLSCFLEEDEFCVLNCGRAHSGVGCDIPDIQDCVCSYDSFCCNIGWDSVCVDEVWNSPCHVDCDCSENDRAFRGGATLPSYWETLGNSRLINTSVLGFNADSGKWCYAHSNTCVKWGERGDTCDDTRFVCAGYMTSPPTIGYGSEQIDTIAEMLSMGDRQHYMCPDCLNTTVCASGETPGTDNALTATFTDCQCDEHHSGFPLITEGYWWGAASNAGLDPSLVTQRAGKWYYNETNTCVGMGSYSGACGGSGCVCAGDGTYGSGDDQMALVFEASGNGGVHPDCPP